MTRSADEHPVANDSCTNDALTATLQSLGRWDQKAPQPVLWQRAIEQCDKAKATGSTMLNSASIFARMLHWPVPKAMAAGIAVVIGLGIVATVLLNSGMARQHAQVTGAASTAPVAAPGAELGESSYLDGRGKIALQPGRGGGGGQSWMQEGKDYSINGIPTGTEAAMLDLEGGYRTDGYPGGGARQPGADGVWPTPSQSSDSDGNRSVVRRATIELIVTDVRGSFIKAMHLVSEAGGEYVQDSALTGSEATAQGNLTLRVRADRLGAVLNELRQLGKVNSEQLGGDDVTAQMVDLDARSRNERRVETELLELLEKRSDAPLKEILELRDQISRVRQTIEQLTAQQERLSRLVSLATVLVLIRPEPKVDAPPPPTTQPEKTLGMYFSESIGSSWHNGLLFLADTVANLLRVFVGGIIWWVALFLILLAARSHWRTKLERAATM